jgi:hypothetical protein
VNQLSFSNFVMASQGWGRFEDGRRDTTCRGEHCIVHTRRRRLRCSYPVKYT